MPVLNAEGSHSIEKMLLKKCSLLLVPIIMNYVASAKYRPKSPKSYIYQTMHFNEGKYYLTQGKLG